MTNGSDMLPTPCSCEGGGGSVVPLLIVAGILAGLHLAGKWYRRTKGKNSMANMKNMAIIAIVVVVAAAAVILTQSKRAAIQSPKAAAENAVAPVSPNPGGEPVRVAQGEKLPRLIDLGAHSCIPCKMMAPILEALKKEYAAVFTTEFIDVWQNPDAGKKYGINVIPTQIFYNADGKELFRHEGFFGKEDILAKWKELGVDPS